MMSVLAKNPLFAANPSCLADFVNSLVQPREQTIPTPTQKEPSQTAEATAAPSAPKPSSEEDSEQAIEARKQFWSKFKRLKPVESPLPADPKPLPANAPLPPAGPTHTNPEPTPAGPQDNPEDRDGLLSLPTLVLGEESQESASRKLAEVVTSSHQYFVDGETIPLDADTPCEAVPVAPPNSESITEQHSPGYGFPQSQPVPDSQIFGDDDLDKLIEKDINQMATELEQPAATTFNTEMPQPDSQAKMVEATASSPVPKPSGSNGAIAAALTRVTTVDLENGSTPLPPRTLIASPTHEVSTVVLLNVGGVMQPVSVPLDADQCLAAGLKLANPIHTDAMDDGNNGTTTAPVPASQATPALAPTSPATPALAPASHATPAPALASHEATLAPAPASQATPALAPASQATPALAPASQATLAQQSLPAPEPDSPATEVATELDSPNTPMEPPGTDPTEADPSSKQMLKNLYMRFSRSRTRSLTINM